MSRAEIEEISEGLIKMYAQKYRGKITQSIDIEHFITEFLSLTIEYTFFAENNLGKIGFLADGETPLLIYHKEKIVPFVFSQDTIVLEKSLLSGKEYNRRRFTMAHEAAHHILGKLNNSSKEALFHTEYNPNRSYSTEELVHMFAATEWQADTMGAALLMPRCIVDNALAKFSESSKIPIYGTNTVSQRDKNIIRKMASFIGVSYTALYIRLKDLNLFEYHDISEYISNELNLGG